MSYLQGRVKGELNAHNPASLLVSQEATDIKLGIIELLMEKPWRANTVGSHLPVVEHARGWLSQGWQTLHQTMQSTRPLPPTSYTAVETLMRQTLFNGFMLADLFPQSGPVRAPWLDLLVGIEEIRALQLLKQSIREAELDYEDGLDMWIDEKLFHLLHVMERTRQAALNRNMYW
jgi:triphosphatase